MTMRCEVTLLGVAEEMYGHLVDVRMLRGREDESCDHEVGCVCMWPAEGNAHDLVTGPSNV